MAFLLTGMLSACNMAQRLAIPDAKIKDSYWAQNSPSSFMVVDHSDWAHILRRYTHRDQQGINRFAYGSVTQADQALLRNYLTEMASVPYTSLSRSEQLAFWINLFNARMVLTILEHFPVNSAREIMAGSFNLLDPGPWNDSTVIVNGRPLTLEQILNGVVRPIWRDPRIHYALSYGAVGSPNLAPLPYTGARLESDLNAAAREFINHPRAVIFTHRESMILSRMYIWYLEDFGGSVETLVHHLQTYAEPPLRNRLEGRTIAYDYEFDWTLNTSSRPNTLSLFNTHCAQNRFLDFCEEFRFTSDPILLEE